MLSTADNELISQVGPGTPMGSLMREYWVPALMSSELPEPDGDPVRVMLLGEQFIAIRDSHGEVGLLPNRCPHRGASLFFGRNEEGGIRCAYHGWKFDVTGRCLDMPNEPADSNFTDKVRAAAPAVVERGGLVWAYLGSRAEPPALPDFEYLDDEHAGSRRLSAYQVECNYLQTLEGDIDTSHFGFLHTGHLDETAAPEGSFLRHMLTDRAPRYKLIDTPVGASYGAYRPAGGPDQEYWRIAHFMFPFYTMIPIGALGDSAGFFARVPLDDTHTMIYFADAGYGRQNSDLAVADDAEVGLKLMPNTTDWFGRFRSARTLDNDFEIDRDLQRSGQSWTGLEGVPLQDRAVNESMGGVADRTHEHLGSADVMVIRVRRRMLRAARAFADAGTPPPGVDNPRDYRQRSGGIVLPTGTDWLEATERLRAGSARQDGADVLAAGV